MYNVVLVLGVQQNNSVKHIYIYIYIHTHTHIHMYMYTHSFQSLFSCRLLQNIE